MFGFILCLILSGFGSFADEKKYKDNINSLEEVIANQKVVIDSLFIPLIKKEKDWNLFIEALIWVESKNDVNAVNERTGASGILQIMPVLIDDVNRICGYDKYTLDDRFNAKKSREIFDIIQSVYNPDKDLNLALVIWNSRASWEYHNKVLTRYNKLLKLNNEE